MSAELGAAAQEPSGAHGAEAMAQGEDAGAQRKYVRVTGHRGKSFVEFEFAVGSPDLFVELILPEPAFAEFCRRHDVTPLPSSDEGEARDALAWRLRDATAPRSQAERP